MHRGVATFTLDYGKCPKWLFERMVRLGREMTRVLIEAVERTTLEDLAGSQTERISLEREHRNLRRPTK